MRECRQFENECSLGCCGASEQDSIEKEGPPTLKQMISQLRSVRPLDKAPSSPVSHRFGRRSSLKLAEKCNGSLDLCLGKNSPAEISFLLVWLFTCRDTTRVKIRRRLKNEDPRIDLVRSPAKNVPVGFTVGTTVSLPGSRNARIASARRAPIAAASSRNKCQLLREYS